MNRIFTTLGLLAVLNSFTSPANADENINDLRRQLEQLKQEYETRIQALEQKLERAEQAAVLNVPASTQPSQVAADAGENRFNPAISLILDGRYSNFSVEPEEYRLAGFPLAGEAGPGKQGFALGHSELVISANADDRFFGRFTAAFDIHGDETSVEVEEAFLETLSMPYSLKLRAGRFYSSIGYLNSKHQHQWDFADAPLVYRGLFGDNLLDDGLQLSWLAPTDIYFELGSELLAGGRYPVMYEGDTLVPAYTFFAKLGGDLGISHSWQAGLSLLNAKVDGIAGDGHDHGAAAADEYLPINFTGDSKTWGLDLVWKWAPQGNNRQRHLVLQYEYFHRDNDGMLSEESGGSGSFEGSKSGWYAQAVYQFMPQWRLGLRYDELHSAATGASANLIDEAGLYSSGHNPWRTSLMADWSNSEFSRIRLQYGYDRSSAVKGSYWIAQYILNLGAHGAHGY